MNGIGRMRMSSSPKDKGMNCEVCDPLGFIAVSFEFICKTCGIKVKPKKKK